MKKITDYISKPSEALKAMVDGLINQSKRKDFKIDMKYFGRGVKGVCFGCAATCAIQQITGRKFTATNVGDEDFEKREKVMKVDYCVFEDCINLARKGIMYDLFNFFQLGSYFIHSYNSRFNLENDNLESQLPKVEKLIAELKAKGL